MKGDIPFLATAALAGFWAGVFCENALGPGGASARAELAECQRERHDATRMLANSEKHADEVVSYYGETEDALNRCQGELFICSDKLKLCEENRP